MLSDLELQEKLAERGYDVPLVVIATWNHKQHYTVNRNVFAVERWLLHDWGKRGRHPRIPQFIIPFDRDLKGLRMLQDWESE